MCETRRVQDKDSAGGVFGGTWLTGQDGESPHRGEGMVSRRVQNVQLINVSPDAVEFPVKVLDGGRVLVVEPLVEEPRDDCSLPNFSGAQNHHPVAVLGRDVELVLGWGHLLNHSGTSRSYPVYY